MCKPSPAAEAAIPTATAATEIPPAKACRDPARPSTAALGPEPAVVPQTSADYCTKLSEIALTDEEASRNEYHFRYFGLLDPLLLSQMKDKRDLPLVYLQLNIVTFLWPLAACLVFGGNGVIHGTKPTGGEVEGEVGDSSCADWRTWSLAVVYLAMLIVGFFERFILMMHFSSHRKLYHATPLNNFTLYCLAPFFGVPPGIYYLHHIIMHHGENNHGLDVSETESYHREENMGFFQYWARFTFGLYHELPLYALKTKRYSWFWTSVVSIAVWVAMIAFCCMYFSTAGTLFVFVVPHYFALTAMALGNYAQHVFVDPDSPGNNYTLSYNCLNTEANQTSFNDGYHILHHIYPRLHWTELPQKFKDTLGEHKRNKALTFRNTHFLPVAILLLTGQLERLVREHYVFIDWAAVKREGGEVSAEEQKDEKVPTVAEMCAELRRRLSFIEPYTRKIE
eukprot:CAMPEP_0178988090 /NCGR_PEP_ID=MMETSP0795-20121207/3622_1 /TAXON_ID=88552 /ORGANISM="Amoebophrya sp., Strain Ameob2" /LENGTH=451 /DNA_ID=CAMNT_0020679335 /DNA_START=209 /DNA_END=1564 /DNA_ORIENTATION=-